MVNPYHDLMEMIHRKPLPEWSNPLQVDDLFERQAGKSDVIRNRFAEFYRAVLPLVRELRKYVEEHRG